MTTHIRAWGNSQGLYIPKKLLREAELEVNDIIEITVVDGGLMIRKDRSDDLKRKAWESIRAIRDAHRTDRSLISSDYKKEMEEYLDEKYGR